MKEGTIDFQGAVVVHHQTPEVSEPGVGAFDDPSPFVSPADKAYDSDPLRERLARRGIELIVPHRSNRKKPATQDGPAIPTNQGKEK